MAEQEEIKGVQVTPEKAAGDAEPDAVELTAPAGWTKKVLGCFCGVCILGFVGFMVACLFVVTAKGAWHSIRVVYWCLSKVNILNQL
ncbi:hypothetical protein ZIOFF_069702 [Zingiber officinale]|uniref:Transmembrane protein n=1 Tax=Zingiber officinale TaxID=94328 RepID=A0A8J5C473_ZINOF|nr:hypothetical protein ZIOFF_069702 [Zingiber officinale]